MKKVIYKTVEPKGRILNPTESFIVSKNNEKIEILRDIANCHEFFKNNDETALQYEKMLKKLAVLQRKLIEINK